MCGIVGIINPGGKWQQGNRKIFQELVFLDVLRGAHSTGVAKVNDNKVDWRKAACPPWEFFRLKDVDDFMSNSIVDADFLIGHNRFATRGEINNANAHPFEQGHITLVHNGTLWGSWRRNLGVKQGIEVDSEGIAYAISKQGIDATSPLIDGAYALVWHDAEEETLNLLRNKERPLFLMYAKDIILYGSEVGLLKWVLTRNGIVPEKWEEIQTHHVYTFGLGKSEPKIKEVKPFVWNIGGWKPFVYQDLPGENDLYTGERGLIEVGAKAPLPIRSGNTSQVVPFRQKHQQNVDILRTTKVSKDDSPARIRLREMATCWPVGTPIHFCLHDYGDTKCQGEFFPVVGFHPIHKSEVVVKGNFSGSLKTLKDTKNKMCGTVTQTSVMKKEDKILIQVKDVIISEYLDDGLLPAKEENQGHTCKECEHKFTYKNHDDPMLVRKNGLETVMCLDCATKYADQTIEASKITGPDGIVYH